MNAILSKDSPVVYVATVVATVLLTAVLAPFREQIGLLNEGFLFLLLTLLVASVWGRGPGLFAAVVANLALNFFFIDPLYRFTVQEPRNTVALGVFLIVSIVGSSLLSAARDAAARARLRQAETEVALALSRAMSGEVDPAEALSRLCQEAVRALAAPGASVLKGSKGHWAVLAHAGSEASARLPSAEERSLADRVARSGEVDGLGRTGLSKSRARVVFPRGREAAFRAERSETLVPLRVGEQTLGVLRLDGPIGDTPFREHPEGLLSAIAGEAALAVHRAELAQAAAHAEALREADELKSALLNAVSHDLRTPLASIIASAGSLQQTDVKWTNEERLGFAEAIEGEAQRLNRLVGNLLDLSRIESGSLRPEKGWYDLGTLIEEVIGRLKPATAHHQVSVDIPPDLPPVALDYIEIDEVLTNLIENATKYTPEGTEVAIRVRSFPNDVAVEVADRGSGIPQDALQTVFEPFYRVGASRVRGTGLGLAVAKGLVEAHGGHIWAENRIAGGASFGFTLPVKARDAAPEPERVR